MVGRTITRQGVPNEQLIALIIKVILIFVALICRVVVCCHSFSV